MQRPKLSNKVKVERVQKLRESAVGYKKPESKLALEKPRPILDEVPVVKKLFVHIKNPDDHESLLALKQISSKFIGTTDIVLVLGDTKKSAIKLPFKVEPSDDFISELVKMLGEDAIVLK